MTVSERFEQDSLEAQKLTRKYFVVGLNFSQESLSELDELAENLDIYMPGGASDENIQLLTRTWGAYFGEVLRRMGAGQWVEADNPHGAIFELPGESFSPHDRVRERMQQGADFSLAEFAKKISQ